MFLELLSSKSFHAFSHQLVFLKNLRHDLGFLVLGPMTCVFVRSKTVMNATLINSRFLSNKKAMSLATCFLLVAVLPICLKALTLSQTSMILLRGAILEVIRSQISRQADCSCTAFPAVVNFDLIRFSDDTQYKSNKKY